MKDLLIYILNHLVDNPDQVQVEETTDDSGLVTLNATVAAEDMGKVIGKGGKVINAIRQIVRIKAIKEGKRVTINVAEPGGSTHPSKTEETPSEETPTQEASSETAPAEETPAKDPAAEEPSESPSEK